MVMLTRGPNAGEYVACCALSRCGYLGKLSSESGWIGPPDELLHIHSFHGENAHIIWITHQALSKTKWVASNLLVAIIDISHYRP